MSTIAPVRPDKQEAQEGDRRCTLRTWEGEGSSKKLSDPCELPMIPTVVPPSDRTVHRDGLPPYALPLPGGTYYHCPVHDRRVVDTRPFKVGGQGT